MTATENLLIEATALRKAQQLVGEQPGDRFNIFQVLGLESNEVRTHSQFLATLLDPKGAHGLGDVFLKIWLQQLGIADFDTSQAHCISEHFIGTVTETEGGRIDIYLSDNSTRIIVENKIYAADQTNQLLRYYNHDPKAKLYYLTLFGTDPGEESTGRGKLGKEQYECISYAVHVIQWLEECRKEAAQAPTVRETITQYIQLIKKLTNQHFDGKMEAKMVDKILSDADHLRSFFELQSPGLVQSVYASIVQNLEHDLQELASSLGLKLNFYFKERKRWQGFTFYGDPALDSLGVWIDFQFDSFPNGLKVGFSYPPDPNHQPIKPAFDLSPLTRQFKAAFPNGRPQDWWASWVYWNYAGPEVCRDMYFSKTFIGKIGEKVVQLLDMAKAAKVGVDALRKTV